MIESIPTGDLSFIDLFAGCGGLSLGLMQAGWQGLFAIEKSDLAFETLKYNLLSPAGKFKYNWPIWLQKSNFEIDEFLKKHRKDLHAYSGQFDHRFRAIVTTCEHPSALVNPL